MKKTVFLLILIISLFSLTACDFTASPPSAEGYPYDELEQDAVPSRDDMKPLSLGGSELESLLDDITVPNTYQWTCEVTYSFDDTETIYRVVKQVSGDNIRFDKYSERGTLLMYSIYKNGTLTVIDNMTGEVYKNTKPDPSFLGSIVNLSDPVLILRTGGEDNISDIVFGYESSDPALSFTYFDDAYNFSEEYMIRLSDGIPLRVESRIADELVYTLVTTDVTYSIPDEDIFDLPGYAG